jgi:hypothetical protein
MIAINRNPVWLVVLTGFASVCGVFLEARGETALDDATSITQAFEQARQTVERADDAALARRLFIAAQAAEADSATLATLCDHVLKLTERDAAHFEMGLAAMKLLAEAQPGEAIGAMERAVETAEYHYKRGLSQQKINAGRLMVDAMTRLADRYAEADQWTFAQTYYEAAASFARDMASDNRGDIEKRLSRIAQHRKLAELKKHFAANATDTTLAAQLMRMQLIEMDDPQAAWSYWPSVDDADLKHHAELAQRDPSALTPQQAMDMGRWYQHRIDDASMPMKPAMVRRAVSYYQRLSQIRYATDEQTLVAREALAELGTFDPAAAVAEAGQTAKPADRDAEPAEVTLSSDAWSDALKRFRIEQLNVQNWRYDSGVLTIDARTPHRVAGIAAPLQITIWPRTMLNYECVMQLAYDPNAGSIGLIIPVRDRGMRLTLVGDRDDGAVAYLTRKLALKPNERYTVKLNVVTIGDQVDVRLTVNDEEPLALSAGEKLVARLTDAPSLGVFATDAVVHFYKADLKLLSPVQAAAEHQRNTQSNDGDGVIDFFGVSAGSIR